MQRPSSNGGPLHLSSTSLLTVLSFLLLLLASLPSYTLGQTLAVSTQPALAVGGDSFLTQPVVNILDSGGNLYTTFSGYLYASMQASPTGYEEIRYNSSTTNTDNMVAVSEGRGMCIGIVLAYENIVKGKQRLTSSFLNLHSPSPNTFAPLLLIATFSGLYINEQGSGYQLRFIGLDASHAAFAYVDSATFDVVTGSPHQISITTYPGSAKGGLPFGVQPVISLQDKGFNVLSSFSGTAAVTVAMATTVNNAVLRSTEVRARKSRRTGQ